MIETFDIKKAVGHFQKFETESRKRERDFITKKKEILKNDIKKELNECREIKSKYEYISDYLHKSDSRSGLYKDLPDQELSYRSQSVLRQFLFKKLIEEDRQVSYSDIVPEQVKQSIVRQKFKKLLTCDNKLMSLGDGYILKFADDLKTYVSENQIPDLGKMTIKQYTGLYDYLWDRHSAELVEKYNREFDLIKEKAILLQYLEELSKVERESYMQELFKKNGVSNVRKFIKTYSKMTD